MLVEPVKLQNKFFEHLPASELEIMRVKESNKTGFCFTVVSNHQFYVFIDLDNESVHVRHIGGKFAWDWRVVELLCQAVCLQTGLNLITVVADKPFMVFAVKRLDFEVIDGDLYGKYIS